MIPNSNKLSDYVHYFFTCYLPQHRDVSPHTLAGYKQAFLHLLRYWKLHSPAQPNPGLDQFQAAFLLDFLSHLEKQLGNTASTRNTRLAAVKSFFKMVSLLQPRYQDQCRQILSLPLKRTPRRRPDFLEKKEVDAVFASVDTASQDGYRDLCILRTLYNTGARASELCGIHIPDVDFDHKQVLLYGKGRKARTVPLWNSTVAFLRTYLKSERRVPLAPYRDCFFINQRRGRLTRSGLYYLCGQYLAEATCKAPTIGRKKMAMESWSRTSSAPTTESRRSPSRSVSSTRGAETQAILMSIFRTCQLRGIDPITFLAASVAAAIGSGAPLPIPESPKQALAA